MKSREVSSFSLWVWASCFLYSWAGVFSWNLFLRLPSDDWVRPSSADFPLVFPLPSK